MYSSGRPGRCHDSAVGTFFSETIVRVCDISTEPAEAAAAAVECQTKEENSPQGVIEVKGDVEVTPRGHLDDSSRVEIEVIPAFEAMREGSLAAMEWQQRQCSADDEDAAMALQAFWRPSTAPDTQAHPRL